MYLVYTENVYSKRYGNEGNDIKMSEMIGLQRHEVADQFSPTQRVGLSRHIHSSPCKGSSNKGPGYIKLPLQGECLCPFITPGVAWG